jgi:glucuronate isomerase
MYIALTVVLISFIVVSSVLLHSDIKYMNKTITTLTSLNKKMLEQAEIVRNPETSEEDMANAIAKATLFNDDFDGVMARMKERRGMSSYDRFMDMVGMGDRRG